MSTFAPMPEREWIMVLAALMTPHDPATTARALKQFVANLRLPSAAYTQGSLDAVASYKRRMSIPAFDEVATPLRAWWAENRPSVPALPAPTPDRHVTRPPTEDEVAKVAETFAAWKREVADRTPAVNAREKRPVAKYLTGEALRRSYIANGLTPRPGL